MGKRAQAERRQLHHDLGTNTRNKKNPTYRNPIKEAPTQKPKGPEAAPNKQRAQTKEDARPNQSGPVVQRVQQPSQRRRDPKGLEASTQTKKHQNSEAFGDPMEIDELEGDGRPNHYPPVSQRAPIEKTRGFRGGAYSQVERPKNPGPSQNRRNPKGIKPSGHTRQPGHRNFPTGFELNPEPRKPKNRSNNNPTGPVPPTANPQLGFNVQAKQYELPLAQQQKEYQGQEQFDAQNNIQAEPVKHVTNMPFELAAA